MQRKKMTAVLLALLLMIGVMNGCSALFGSENQASQYGPYVQSLLDVSYKGDSVKYLELVNDTKEAADGYYADTMEYWAYAVADSLQVVLINDQTESRMIQMMKDVFARAKYEVADAVKTESYYTVKVTIYPIIFIDMAYDDVVTFAEDFQARSNAGEYGDYENDEAAYNAWEEAYANGVMDILESFMSQITYGDPVEKIVKINIDEDGIYGISAEDQSDLESYLLY